MNFKVLLIAILFLPTLSFAASAPFILGSVTDINGQNITIFQKSGNVSYAVDVSEAKFFKSTGLTEKLQISLSDLQIGDFIKISGTITGQNIKADEIIIEKAPKHFFVGTISSVNNPDFSIDILEGKNKITYNVKNNPTSVNGISIGKIAFVSGTVDANSKTITADTIKIAGVDSQKFINSKNSVTKIHVPGFFESFIKFLGHLLSK